MLISLGSSLTASMKLTDPIFRLVLKGMSHSSGASFFLNEEEYAVVKEWRDLMLDPSQEPSDIRNVKREIITMTEEDGAWITLRGCWPNSVEWDGDNQGYVVVNYDTTEPSDYLRYITAIEHNIDKGWGAESIVSLVKIFEVTPSVILTDKEEIKEALRKLEKE